MADQQLYDAFRRVEQETAKAAIARGRRGAFMRHMGYVASGSLVLIVFMLGVLALGLLATAGMKWPWLGVLLAAYVCSWGVGWLREWAFLPSIPDDM